MDQGIAILAVGIMFFIYKVVYHKNKFFGSMAYIVLGAIMLMPAANDTELALALVLMFVGIILMIMHLLSFKK